MSTKGMKSDGNKVMMRKVSKGAEAEEPVKKSPPQWEVWSGGNGSIGSIYEKAVVVTQKFTTLAIAPCIFFYYFLLCNLNINLFGNKVI